ncbi:MAG: glycosyltransferase [Kiritimatiellae bacterium]|nr:glycosyltransferase [Kiritimatiellia bacterium]
MHLYKGAAYFRPLVKNYIAILFYRMRLINGFIFEDAGAVDWCRRRHIKAERLSIPGVFCSLRSKTKSPFIRFTLYGVISEAKSASSILQAWAALDLELKTRARLQIKGRILERDAAVIRECMDSINDTSIEWYDEFISNQAVEDLLANSDVVLLLYSPIHVGCSGVLTQAASTATPVLAVNMGWIGYTVKHYQLGQVVDALDHITIKDALESCISQGVSFNTDKARQFAGIYDAAAYGNAFVNIICHGAT